MRLLQLKLNICNFNFFIMHVVPTRASSPQHKEHKYTHRASSPQHKSKSSQSIKPSTSNEYAWTQQLTTWTTSTTYMTPIFWNNNLQLDNFD
ncbi:hypothetical protein MTR_7g106370 [Medicago truncatula]|uniref:Uncharacterized protein n=1 Tax=Medicago truncatula TaxID=3880 RepID=A0A072U3E4_MEDTR|nr:hypothetical protein MTR_7g106370 [Medicago truncatula]